MAAYPDAKKHPIAEKLNEQVPLLRNAAKGASKTAAAERRKQELSNRHAQYLRCLEEAWHGDGWMLPELFCSNSRSQGKGFKDLHYICSITDIALKHGIDLPSLWQPGGAALSLLHDQLEQEDGQQDQDSSSLGSDSEIDRIKNPDCHKSDAADSLNYESPENARVTSLASPLFDPASPISLAKQPVIDFSPVPDSPVALPQNWLAPESTKDLDVPTNHDDLDIIHAHSVRGKMITNGDGPVQEDASSCGAFVVAALECLLVRDPIDFSAAGTITREALAQKAAEYIDAKFPWKVASVAEAQSAQNNMSDSSHMAEKARICAHDSTVQKQRFKVQKRMTTERAQLREAETQLQRRRDDVWKLESVEAKVKSAAKVEEARLKSLLDVATTFNATFTEAQENTDVAKEAITKMQKTMLLRTKFQRMTTVKTSQEMVVAHDMTTAARTSASDCKAEVERIKGALVETERRVRLEEEKEQMAMLVSISQGGGDGEGIHRYDG
ncbi:uncharacterized protein LY79DRAFT_674300 [Colletotrichum navitas]|uniref:Uncharacterized protein n=1 Tax=Colletotrichum navitas TaxID=681940 RepID=A0AAD8PMS8_9PEZI|nr:uncharacterized protein LY79DRAFT_674300 [Colletotrichum navitas]KAK1570008.1 hypothetical protein LY79DRAFT_674300 [Colletotrichum navitas]